MGTGDQIDKPVNRGAQQQPEVSNAKPTNPTENEIVKTQNKKRRLTFQASPSVEE